MSTSFEARFSPTSLSLDQILTALESVMEDCRLRFTGAFMPLSSHKGWPTVKSLEFASAESMSEVVQATGKWWGVGLECSSGFVADELGRTDASEVYFNIFKTTGSKWTLSYLESSRATDLRKAISDGAADLVRLQLTLCQILSCEISIYDEQNHNRKPVPTIRDVKVALKQAGSDPREDDLCIVVSTARLSVDQAQELAGPRRDEIAEAITGYVVAPFLNPTRGPG